MSGQRLRDADNPYRGQSPQWYAWKEKHLGYVPYHVGTTPEGAQCREMPRVRLVRPGVHRCPACGKEFPTALAECERLGLEVV